MYGWVLRVWMSDLLPGWQRGCWSVLCRAVEEWLFVLLLYVIACTALIASSCSTHN